ncbi:hypothetical protein RYX36_002978 [Vicia faba]
MDQVVHWYLLVVDLFDRELVWLDSMPSSERYHFRRHAILSVVVTPTRMKLALYLFQSSNNVLLNEIVFKTAKYWDIHEKRRKAMVKI